MSYCLLLLIVSLVADGVHLDSLQPLDSVVDPKATMDKKEVLLATNSTSYEVEGCFSSVVFATSFEDKEHNSNLRCQDTCKDKGYILAGTKGYTCGCGNIFPKGLKVKSEQCRQKCRSWGSCHSVQSCCGGSNAYTISAVGNIDVGKQVLRRLSHAWNSNNEYRKYMMKKVPQPKPKSSEADWGGSFDKAGMSKCGKDTFMTGLYRSGGNPAGIFKIEKASCLEPAGHLYAKFGKVNSHCYTHDWTQSFNKKGWVTCNQGYYMIGLERSAPPNQGLSAIEKGRCCKPRTVVKKWGHCYNLDLWGTFDNKGWGKCGKGYYMVGMHRNACNDLHCLEEFKCCKMGSYNGEGYVNKPTFSINIKDVSGNLKHCSMDAKDNTPASTSYKCEGLSKIENMLTLNAVELKIEEKTALNIAKPEPIKNFRPVTCSASTSAYTCTKTLSTTISTTSSFTIGTGFSMSVMIGASLTLSAKFLGSGVDVGLNMEITGTTEFNTERSKSHTHEDTDETHVSIEVPANKAMTINMMRTKEDLEYKWKADFQLLGKYHTKWADDTEEWQDASTVLSGVDSHLYAFGTWKYPGVDMIKVIVTDKFGEKEGEGCEHKSKTNTTCHV